MMQKNSAPQKELMFAIILAAILISGSLIFLGLQMRQEAQSSSGIDQQALTQQIKQEMLDELLNGDLLAQEIEKGIQNYIQKQQEAQQKAREEQQRAAAEKAKNVPRVDVEQDHIYGDPEAEISLIEYSDFECPYCKRFHATPKELVEIYEGKVNWVYRHYPLQFHNPEAQKEAEASECAAELGENDAFWQYGDLIYERTKSNKGFPLDNLVPLAEEIGLDKKQFQECLDSGRYAEKVQKDLKEGTDSGITGTPGSILLNNTTGEVSLQVGAVPLNTLKAAVDELLK